MIIEEEEEDGDINRVHDLILKKSCVNVNDYDSRNKSNVNLVIKVYKKK